MIYNLKVDTEHMKGEIKISLLPWSERVSKSKELLYKLQDGKLVDRDDLERYELAIAFAVSRVESVDITLANGQKVSSVDDFMMYREGTRIMNEVSSILVNGVSLEKK